MKEIIAPQQKTLLSIFWILVKYVFTFNNKINVLAAFYGYLQTFVVQFRLFATVFHYTIIENLKLNPFHLLAFISNKNYMLPYFIICIETEQIVPTCT